MNIYLTFYLNKDSWEIKILKLITATVLLFFMRVPVCLGTNSAMGLTHEEISWIKENPSIKVGVPDIPPFCFYEHGRVKGYYADIFKRVLQQAGLTAEYIPALPMQEIIEGLQTNRLDAALALIVSPDRNDFIDFSNHQFTLNIAIFGRKGETSITDLSSMEGKTVSTYAGHGLDAFIRKHFDPSHIIMADNADEMMRLVDGGKADACFKELHTGDYIILHNNLHSVESKGFISIGGKMDIVDAIWGVGKKASVLGGILNKAYDAIPLAEIQALGKKYFLTDTHAAANLQLTKKEQDWLAQHHTINARVAYWPPYQFWQNGPQGISVDYLKKIGEKYGLDIQFYAADEPWAKALENLINHRRPDLLTTIHHTPEREKDIAFSTDYLSIPWVIFNRKDGDFIGGIDDLRGKTVAVQRDFVMQDILKDEYPEIKILTVNDTLEELKAVSTGQVDASIDNLAVGTHIIQENGLFNVKVAAPTPFPNHTQAFGIRSDWPELASIISKGIEAMPLEEKNDIRRKWLSVRYEYGISWIDIGLWSLGIILTASVIIGIILYSHRRLKQAHLKLFEEMTHRKAVQVELEKLSRAVENSPATILITDLEGRIEYINPAFMDSSGYSRQEALGEHIHMLRSKMHNDNFYSEIWKTITDGGSWRGELCSRKKNGQLYWEQALIAPVKDDGGSIINFVHVKEDISDKKDLEQLKEDVDRIMRHDLKTPLNGIIGMAQILKYDGRLNDEQQLMVDMLNQAGMKMLHMINLSLDVFKIETGRYKYVPEYVDILHELRCVIGQKQSDIVTKQLSINVKLEGAALEEDFHFNVPSNKRLLFSILTNLVTNAIEASPQNGNVEINLQRGESTILAIRNKGAVPKVIRGAFYQKYVTYGKKNGTGLGTYSAKLMADAMGYELQMETWDETDMTEVRVVIPGT